MEKRTFVSCELWCHTIFTSVQYVRKVLPYRTVSFRIVAKTEENNFMLLPFKFLVSWDFPFAVAIHILYWKKRSYLMRLNLCAYFRFVKNILLSMYMRNILISFILSMYVPGYPNKRTFCSQKRVYLRVHATIPY